jgi:hypothetical protein
MKKIDGGKSKSAREIENCLDYYEIRVKRSLRDPKFVLEIAGFVVLFVYAIYTIKMYYANRDSADAAKSAAETADKSMKLAYRPRLLLIGIDARVKTSPIGMEEPVLDEHRLTVQIQLPNTGPFTARNVRFFRYSNVSQRAQARKGVYEELFGESKAIPPKVENYNPGIVVVGTKTVTDPEIQGLQRGTLWATFSILVQYDDDFGITHHTEYCDLFNLTPYNDICPWPVQND